MKGVVARMTPKQEMFVHEYLIDLNATQAAIRAGYSAKTAKAIGQQNLTKLDVKAAIDAELLKRRKKNEVSAEYVITSLREIAERCLQRAPVVNSRGNQVFDSDGNALWEFNSSGANRALELLGKHLGMFTEKVQMDMTLSPATILAEVDRRRALHE
jgi:phage terminase small subunit